jgi:leader peptidase (prepilin peptidase)/N-methyltransferase
VTDETLVIVFAALLGGLIGSFLNVCILRWPREESVIRPRSHCPGCGKPIAWYDNVPILSWLILRGRCRHCQTRISIQYPLIELTVALIWGLMVWRYGLEIKALQGAVFFTILLGIALTDAREYIIPDEFSLGGLVIGILFSLAGGFSGIVTGLLGAAVGFALLWGVGAAGTRLFKEDAMGGGDIKMMAMVGAFVGWQGVLLTVFLGALLGTLVFVPLSVVGKKRLVPFGVFLSLGAAATWLAGSALIAWYKNFVLVQ